MLLIAWEIKISLAVMPQWSLFGPAPRHKWDIKRGGWCSSCSNRSCHHLYLIHSSITHPFTGSFKTQQQDTETRALSLLWTTSWSISQRNSVNPFLFVCFPPEKTQKGRKGKNWLWECLWMGGHVLGASRESEDGGQGSKVILIPSSQQDLNPPSKAGSHSLLWDDPAQSYLQSCPQSLHRKYNITIKNCYLPRWLLLSL